MTRRSARSAAAIALALVAYILPTSAQQTTSGEVAKPQAYTIPPGPNRDLVQNSCTQCHDSGNFIGMRHSRDEWAEVLDQMAGNGMTVDDEQRAKILDYLAASLGS